MDTFDLFSALEDILAAPAPQTLQVGMEVGAGRWPYFGGHPGNWQPPHKGILLAPDDPRAWRGTVLGDEPTGETIRVHLAWIEQDRKGRSEALRYPVLWAFNPQRAMWESATYVVPYHEDLARWRQAHDAALKGGTK